MRHRLSELIIRVAIMFMRLAAKIDGSTLTVTSTVRKTTELERS